MKLIWLEAVLGFVVPVGWGLWQLHTLRRDKRAAAQREAAQREVAQREAAANAKADTRAP